MTVRSAAFCARLGIEVPIVQALIGNISTPELAAAVCNAGGLGMIGVGGMPVDMVQARLRATRQLTGRPFGANVILAISPAQTVDVALDAGVKILSLFWGDPAPFVARAHQAGALVLTTVASAREAREAVAAEVDIVVAQGWEAGGHVRGTVSTLALVPRVVDEVDPVPVIAAGGIADGRGVAAVLALGAAAAVDRHPVRLCRGVRRAPGVQAAPRRRRGDRHGPFDPIRPGLAPRAAPHPSK